MESLSAAAGNPGMSWKSDVYLGNPIRIAPISWTGSWVDSSCRGKIESAACDKARENLGISLRPAHSLLPLYFPLHVPPALTLFPKCFNLSARFDICSLLHFFSSCLFLTSPSPFPPLLQSLLVRANSREYSKHSAERFGDGGGGRVKDSLLSTSHGA